jgi:hypothetical protein
MNVLIQLKKQSTHLQGLGGARERERESKGGTVETRLTRELRFPEWTW